MNPAQLPADEFSAIVAAQLATLPGWVQRAVQRVAFLTEDQPPPGAGPEHGLLLGRYHGVPLTRRGYRASGSLPDTIVLCREPILPACRRAADVPARVRRVLCCTRSGAPSASVRSACANWVWAEPPRSPAPSRPPL